MTTALDGTEIILFQSPAFKAKLIKALAICSQALSRSKKPYIAFSGGKDSMAVTALAHTIRPDIVLNWSDDELEYPETVELMTAIDKQFPDQIIITAGWAEHAGWFRPWAEYPFFRTPIPGTIEIGCAIAEWMAIEGYDLTFLGTRMFEGTMRMGNIHRTSWLLQSGPIYKVRAHPGYRCCPIYDWTDDDVWALIAGWKLPYNKVYDVLSDIGVHRTAQRVGPLPLSRRSHLKYGWPELLSSLESRYGKKWR